MICKSTLKSAVVVITLIVTATPFFAQTPAPVYITAGQSNADGREWAYLKPAYLDEGYNHLRYKNVTSSSDGKFEDFSFGNRFAFCDVVNYFIDRATENDFYAIKCAYGGTAIDTAATYSHLPVWCADEEWIEANNAYRGDIETGKSLTKSLTEGFADCVDVTLSQIKQGYDVKAIMWHQGESDRSQADHYYKNFSDMITYMRKAISAKTGKEKDLTLPFIFGTVSKKSSQYSSSVEIAQKQVAEDLENVYYIDLSDAGLRSDNLHFDSAWTEYIGKAMYNKLVELGLAEGEIIENVKPTTPSATDSLVVELERSWDFEQPWSEQSINDLENDDYWPTYQSLGYRYSSAISSLQQLQTSWNDVFAETEGLWFESSKGNRIIINPGNYLCFYGDELLMTLPKVSPGQYVTIETKSAKGDRGLTTDSEEYLNTISGGEKTSSRVKNIWQVKDDVEDVVDLVFHSNGGAIYVYNISISSPSDTDAICNAQKEDNICYSQWYSLGGQRVKIPRKGLYIRNGKKCVLN